MHLSVILSTLPLGCAASEHQHNGQHTVAPNTQYNITVRITPWVLTTFLPALSWVLQRRCCGWWLVTARLRHTCPAPRGPPILTIRCNPPAALRQVTLAADLSGIVQPTGSTRAAPLPPAPDTQQRHNRTRHKQVPGGTDNNINSRAASVVCAQQIMVQFAIVQPRGCCCCCAAAAAVARLRSRGAQAGSQPALRPRHQPRPAACCSASAWRGHGL